MSRTISQMQSDALSTPAYTGPTVRRVPRKESGPPNNCAKCGVSLTGLPIFESIAKDGGVWRYCSITCEEKH